MKLNTLIDNFSCDDVAFSPSPVSYNYISVRQYLEAQTKADVLEALPGALSFVEWMEDENGDVIGDISLRDGFVLSFRWMFSQSGIAEMLTITAGEADLDDAERERVLGQVMDGLPSAQLSVHFRDEYDDSAPVSVLYEPLRRSAGWLDIRFRAPGIEA